MLDNSVSRTRRRGSTFTLKDLYCRASISARMAWARRCAAVSPYLASEAARLPKPRRKKPAFRWPAVSALNVSEA